MTSTEDAAVILWLAQQLAFIEKGYSGQYTLRKDTAEWIERARTAVREDMKRHASN